MKQSGSLAKAHRMAATSDKLSTCTHFSSDECKVLLHIYDKLTSNGRLNLDRIRMREIMETAFQITDDVMLDLVYKAFDRDNDGIVNDSEWVKGLSVMIRGDINELIEHCYYVYDMNGDGSLAREELSHCLKGCIVPGYGLDGDEVEDCERDIVEICMKKLDKDRDGQITFSDFQTAVLADPLLLQVIGPCLPGPKSVATFMALITDKFRTYTETYGRSWIRKDKLEGRKSRNFIMGNVTQVTRRSTYSRKSIAPDSKRFEAIIPLKLKS